MARSIIPVRERFLSKVEPEPMSGCWLWNGSYSAGGYGQISVSRNGCSRMVRAHRLCWEIFAGEIPSGMQICHRCDNRSCVNPDHLFLGSNLDNQVDKAAKYRGTKSALGLPYGVSRQRRGGGFQVQVWHRKRRVHGGTFVSAAAAGLVAVELKKRTMLGGEE